MEMLFANLFIGDARNRSAARGMISFSKICLPRKDVAAQKRKHQEIIWNEVAALEAPENQDKREQRSFLHICVLGEVNNLVLFTCVCI